MFPGSEEEVFLRMEALWGPKPAASAGGQARAGLLLSMQGPHCVRGRFCRPLCALLLSDWPEPLWPGVRLSSCARSSVVNFCDGRGVYPGLRDSVLSQQGSCGADEAPFAGLRACCLLLWVPLLPRGLRPDGEMSEQPV